MNSSKKLNMTGKNPSPKLAILICDPGSKMEHSHLVKTKAPNEPDISSTMIPDGQLTRGTSVLVGKMPIGEPSTPQRMLEDYKIKTDGSTLGSQFLKAHTNNIGMNSNHIDMSEEVFRKTSRSIGREGTNGTSQKPLYDLPAMRLKKL
jgi:hypothetical protein